MSNAFLAAVPILAAWGIFWLMWDNRAVGPGWVLGAAGACAGLSFITGAP